MRGEESPDPEIGGRMEESAVRRSLEALCQELNMDEQTASAAMDNFNTIWNTYTLEVSAERKWGRRSRRRFLFTDYHFKPLTCLLLQQQLKGG